MQYRTLGRTGLEVSAVGLGTWAFGSAVYGSVGESDALATIGRALDTGITFFDSAPLYGEGQRDGIAEEILGRGLGTRRDNVVISTKFGRKVSDGCAPNFHAERAFSSVEESLRRLGTDRIDLLFFHSPFSAAEINDDVWGALDTLRQQGKVRHVGHSISMFQDTEGMARAWYADRKIDAVQVVYSLMNRESERLITELGANGCGVVARESLANGFLTGTINRDTVFPPGSMNTRYSREEIAERVDYVDSLRFLVRGRVTGMAQAALRWVLDNPRVSLVLTGARNPAELNDGAAAADLPPFTPDELCRAEALHTKDFPAA